MDGHGGEGWRSGVVCIVLSVFDEMTVWDLRRWRGKDISILHVYISILVYCPILVY